MKKKFDNGEKIMCWDDYFVVYTLKMKIYYKKHKNISISKK